MSEREEEIKADMLTFRSMASLDVSTRDVTMVQVGLHVVIIAERRQAQILHDIYDGIVKLAEREGNSWEETLRLIRSNIGEGAEDANMQRAYEKFMRQTDHLFEQ